MRDWYYTTRGLPFTNATGEEIPPFACMGIEDTSIEQGEVILEVRKPNAADAAAGSGRVVFNGEVAVPNNGGGWAVMEPVVHALQASSLGLLAECGPVEDEWKLGSAGTGFIKLATDADSHADGIIVRSAGGGGSSDEHFLYTLTSTMTGGSGTATIRNMADTSEIATGQTVLDKLGHFEGLTSGKRGVCIKQAGAYYAITPYLTGVRWNTPNLERSHNGGSTWDNIDTAEPCP